MDHNPGMDSGIDIEALRETLRRMSRAEARKVANAAGLACSTVEKFRLSRINEPRLSKLQKLHAALHASTKADKRQKAKAE